MNRKIRKIRHNTRTLKNIKIPYESEFIKKRRTDFNTGRNEN